MSREEDDDAGVFSRLLDRVIHEPLFFFQKKTVSFNLKLYIKMPRDEDKVRALAEYVAGKKSAGSGRD
jgi:hypothetical protein